MASPVAHMIIDIPPHPFAEPRPQIPLASIQPTGPADPQFPATTATNQREVAPALQPADYRDTEAQRGMLICCFIGCIIIRVLGENYGDSSGRLWMMYLTEAEKEDKEITESWKGDTDGILVFVGARPSNFCFTASKAHVEDWSVLLHRRDLHCRELPEPIT